jgi:hypothetical protein
LNNRGGTIGEREVYISLKKATMSRTMPTISGARVCGVDPKYITSLRQATYKLRILTACLTKVETNQDTHDASDDEGETQEIEFGNMLLQCFAMMRVQVEEHKKDSKCNSASRTKETCQ